MDTDGTTAFANGGNAAAAIMCATHTANSAANPRGAGCDGDSSYVGPEVNLGLTWRFAPGLAFDLVGPVLFTGSALDTSEVLNGVLTKREAKNAYQRSRRACASRSSEAAGARPGDASVRNMPAPASRESRSVTMLSPGGGAAAGLGHLRSAPRGVSHRAHPWRPGAGGLRMKTITLACALSPLFTAAAVPAWAEGPDCRTYVHAAQQAIEKVTHDMKDMDQVARDDRVQLHTLLADARMFLDAAQQSCDRPESDFDRARAIAKAEAARGSATAADVLRLHLMKGSAGVKGMSDSKRMTDAVTDKLENKAMRR